MLMALSGVRDDSYSALQSSNLELEPAKPKVESAYL
jgi:hypothetical protein